MVIFARANLGVDPFESGPLFVVERLRWVVRCRGRLPFAIQGVDQGMALVETGCEGGEGWWIGGVPVGERHRGQRNNTQQNSVMVNDCD